LKGGGRLPLVATSVYLVCIYERFLIRDTGEKVFQFKDVHCAVGVKILFFYLLELIRLNQWRNAAATSRTARNLANFRELFY